MIADRRRKFNSAVLFFPDAVRLLRVSSSTKLVAASIFTRTYMENEAGFARVSHSCIEGDVGVSSDSITSSIKQLKAAGLIKARRTQSGNFIKWIGGAN